MTSSKKGVEIHTNLMEVLNGKGMDKTQDAGREGRLETEGGLRGAGKVGKVGKAKWAKLGQLGAWTGLGTHSWQCSPLAWRGPTVHTTTGRVAGCWSRCLGGHGGQLELYHSTLGVNECHVQYCAATTAKAQRPTSSTDLWLPRRPVLGRSVLPQWGRAGQCDYLGSFAGMPGRGI